MQQTVRVSRGIGGPSCSGTGEKKTCRGEGEILAQQISQWGPGGRWREQCRPWFNVLGHEKRKYS